MFVEIFRLAFGRESYSRNDSQVIMIVRVFLILAIFWSVFWGVLVAVFAFVSGA